MKKIIRIGMLIASLHLLVACIPTDESKKANTDTTSTNNASTNDVASGDNSSATNADDTDSTDTTNTSTNNVKFEESAEVRSISEARVGELEITEPPAGVYIESIDDVTRVTWEAVGDAEHYNIYAGQGEEDDFIHVHSATPSEEREYYLQEGNEYTGLYVTAVVGEEESPPSSIVFLSPQSSIYSEESVAF